ncbi:DNA mismatch repair endonuclease MutL [Halococcus thailandensis]|uniref:DNA mismatch repair protein MutL n=1 Tax=Halococcus thailandensis JCM 13552 TaxID=1227457 RepID=M0N2P5_9EURY|nr:DNA mismatch repair endonuclease MutL [Halococcus thailandensis]EMA51798.1 DNA mismatch repair protein MutL [Halococcus thailandensis JCM 13552]
MTDGEIHRLDQSTIERIAAGEVVERPASVVKELVENSLDADASRVRIAVERGGKDGVRVTDDGIGMGESAVETAVEKHTTSKIGDIEDLEAGVESLGFRGEALAAIGAVSRLTIRTKARGADRGTELTMVGGEIESIAPAGCPVGTTVEVDDLFYNVPARRKYLKQDQTEFGHVSRVATGYALSNPDRSLTLTHDDTEVFSTTGQGNLESTVLAVYGREVAEAMIPLDGDLDAEGPLDAIDGVVSHPETTRASPQQCTVFVNGRYVRASAVRDAIVDAYGGQLATDRYPFAVVFLSVPSNTVDVNVHPRKQEIRFADEETVRDQVETTVENALLEAGLVRSGAPRGRSAPEQTAIDPHSTDDGTTDHGTTTHETTDREVNDARADGTATDGTEPADPTSTADPLGASSTAEPASSDDELVGEQQTEPTTSTESGAGSESVEGSRSPERTTDGAANGTTEGRKFTETPTQATLDGETVADEPDFERLPRLRVLGQLHDTYFVCESPDGLVLVDQHAAHERVNYERLRERVAGETNIQELAEPVTIELTAAESALFEEFTEALSALGFRASPGDGKTIEVAAVPAVLAGAADPELLRDALSAFVDERDPDETITQVSDALLADLACYPSITANTSLSEGSVTELLRALDDCENPYACPHGRPVVIELSERALEERFERDYPGHAGRRASHDP